MYTPAEDAAEDAMDTKAVATDTATESADAVTAKVTADVVTVKVTAAATRNHISKG